MGIEGLEINRNQYESKILNTIYTNAYYEGFREYQSKKVSEYTQLGLTHGQGDKEMIYLSNLDELFISAYKDAYNEGQKILKDTYIQKSLFYL